jgi:chromosome segregation ATPase
MKTIEELEAELETVTRERDEARAEVEQNKKCIAGLEASLNGASEALYLALQGPKWMSDPLRQLKRDAYRRGAEAMREACAARLGSDAALTRMLAEHLERELRGLPIPEEP